ncbi:hypothetical protein [Synechococcus sp. CS-197]|uniref:hypothetical protein n=1 Tax=Synechococcus sp. CS-197 TaxID=2847985 RepID=UPI00223A80C5|nr:hypothetical protein [Synechococcus sp. CS-197]MCT0250548.1 hypothetical protein [Synechococcus sp. CS-197]
MKQLLIASAVVAVSVQSAAAKTIHLTCKETMVLEDTHVINTAGRISNMPQDLDDLWTRRVMINTSTGVSQIQGSAYKLTIEPEFYRLSEISQEPPSLADSFYSSSQVEVNRKDLSFTYSYSSLTQKE